MQRPMHNMAEYYHELSKDISQGGKVVFPKDEKDFPKSWTTIEYKSYKNSEEILLPNPEIISAKINWQGLNKVILNRKSQRNFDSRKKPITLSELSILCAYSFGKNWITSTDDNVTRNYPSGGARYSLEFYIQINNSSEIRKGIYHYNVLRHSLELVTEFDEENFKHNFGYEFVEYASCVIYITSIFERTYRKYGERGYRYILLEAGHVGENIYLVGSNLDLFTVAVAGSYDRKIEKMIKVDGVNESLLISYVIG